MAKQAKQKTGTRYRVTHPDDLPLVNGHFKRLCSGFQRHALHGPPGYLGELNCSCQVANKIIAALNAQPRRTK